MNKENKISIARDVFKQEIDTLKNIQENIKE